MIQITNQHFYKYNITYNIKEDENVGIYFINNEYLKEFLLLVSGINKADKIFYRSKLVFDNLEYFKERIFLDCSIPILNTLIVDNVAKYLLDNYEIVLNKEKFKDLVKKLQIRKEGKLNVNYDFTKEGINLTNNLLALSIFKYPILLNPFENIKNINNLELLKEEYKEKKALFGITDLKKYYNLLDTIILFSENKVNIFNNYDKLLVLEDLVSLDIIKEVINDEDLIVLTSLNPLRIIIKNTINKEIIKELKSLKVKMTEISVFQIGDYQ